jgi:hypothetical protein
MKSNTIGWVMIIILALVLFSVSVYINGFLKTGLSFICGIGLSFYIFKAIDLMTK